MLARAHQLLQMLRNHHRCALCSLRWPRPSHRCRALIGCFSYMLCGKFETSSAQVAAIACYTILFSCPISPYTLYLNIQINTYKLFMWSVRRTLFVSAVHSERIPPVGLKSACSTCRTRITSHQKTPTNGCSSCTANGWNSWIPETRPYRSEKATTEFVQNNCRNNPLKYWRRCVETSDGHMPKNEKWIHRFLPMYARRCRCRRRCTQFHPRIVHRLFMDD